MPLLACACQHHLSLMGLLYLWMADFQLEELKEKI